MPKPIRISRQQARRFLLAHHNLWPPRRLRGKQAILNYFARVGCIQFDTINVVTRNADLVLQARVKGYKPAVLESMLYKDRSLWDGWDKVQSIYRSADWPHFEPQRKRMGQQHGPRLAPGEDLEVADQVMRAIRERGPLSSLEIDHDEKVDGYWGTETRAARASMEVLYGMGKLGVHQRINTRREFDLVERLLPADLLARPHPHASLDDYHDWHVLRRIGGLGLAMNRGTDQWLGISHLKAPKRQAALERLEGRGAAHRIEIEGLEKLPLLMRAEDLPTLEMISAGRQPRRGAALLAPLDNLMWQRDLIEVLYGFHYRWEVYVPATKRQYGYYVLPVIYGDQFIARLDPAWDKKAGEFTVNDWWWEEGVQPDDAMLAAVAGAIQDFGRYLEVNQLRFSKQARKKAQIASIEALI